MSEILISQKIPILALRGLNVFPGMTVHFDVGRKKSILAVEEAMHGKQELFLIAQRDILIDDPKQKDLFSIGTVAVIKQILKLPGDNIRILVEGKYRAKLVECSKTEPYLSGRVETVEEPGYARTSAKAAAMIRQAHGLYEQFAELSNRNLQEGVLQLLASDDAGFVADYITQNSSVDYLEKGFRGIRDFRKLVELAERGGMDD